MTEPMENFALAEADRLLKHPGTPPVRGFDPSLSLRHQVTLAIELARRAGCYDAQDFLVTKYEKIVTLPAGAQEAKQVIPEFQPQRQDSVTDQLLTVAELLNRLGCLMMAHEISFGLSLEEESK